jgi:hypothetical protein
MLSSTRSDPTVMLLCGHLNAYLSKPGSSPEKPRLSASEGRAPEAGCQGGSGNQAVLRLPPPLLALHRLVEAPRLPQP